MKVNLFLVIVLNIFTSCNQGNEKNDFEDRGVFNNFPEGKTPEEIGEKLIARFIEKSPTMFTVDSTVGPLYNQIFYAEVCAWLGGLWFAKETENVEMANKLEEIFQPLFLPENKALLPRPIHVDFNVFGALPLELYLQTKEDKYLDLGLPYADKQWTLPDSVSDSEKAFHDQGYSWQTRLWIDDMFMITAIQAQAYSVTKNDEYINRAAKEMVLYLDSLQLENGLFYHAPEVPFSWGRGNGWMAVGMPELLRRLPKTNPNYNRIMEGYKKMMAALLKYQTPEGMWRQILDDEEAWLETSCTAMFTYAMITGVKNNWLDEKTYGLAARKAWLALIDYLNEDGDLREVCQGTNIKNDRMHYMNRKRITGDLHGQAPMIWCATALLR